MSHSPLLPAREPPRAGFRAPRSEAGIVAALRAGDEIAFVWLFERHYATMKRVARTYVASDAVAEEIVQETWIAVVSGIERFERRATLWTWIFSILIKQANKHGARERRTTPFASIAGNDDGSFDVDRFQGEQEDWPGRWATPPRPWQRPERRLMSLEAREYLREAITLLPERQRLVLVLRDVEGLPSSEVCQLLGLTGENQRVLLHRARAAMRRALDSYMTEPGST